MITDQRVERMKQQVAVEGGEKVLEHGYTWNTVRVRLELLRGGVR
jgi:hypothetical protein